VGVRGVAEGKAQVIEMLKLPQILTVLYHDRTVGRLSMTPDNERCVFEYDSEWLTNGFSISPLELPLKKELFVAQSKVFYGNFGIFEDSMPDGYGNYLLDRVLKKYGLSLMNMTPVERLSFVGSKGMGALVYVPDTGLNAPEEDITLDRIQQDALDVLSEKDFSRTDVLYFSSGNSGGCRPKCLWHDQDGEWLVKFRHTYDPEDMGLREFEILQTAARCGITVPEARLFNGKYLGTRRFDVSEDGTRLHVATASALLGESIRWPMMDYRKLVRFTRLLTEDESQAQEMFRRMIFNFEIGNNDDHAKNFSFIYSDGQWRISPAYDLTECRGANHGCHSSLVNGKERPTDEDFVIVGSEAGLTKTRAREIIAEIRTIVSAVN